MKSLSLKSLALAGALLLTVAAAGHASADDGRPPGPDPRHGFSPSPG